MVSVLQERDRQIDKLKTELRKLEEEVHKAKKEVERQASKLKIVNTGNGSLKEAEAMSEAEKLMVRTQFMIALDILAHARHLGRKFSNARLVKWPCATLSSQSACTVSSFILPSKSISNRHLLSQHSARTASTPESLLDNANAPLVT